MSKFSLHKLMCLKHIVLISLLSIISTVILGCTCSETEEPVLEPEQAIKEEPIKEEPVKEEPMELKAVEKPESVESGKADSTETVKATPTQRPESNGSGEDDSGDTVWGTPIIKSRPYEGTPSEEEQAAEEEALEDDAYEAVEKDPCVADCETEYTFCQDDCHRLDDPNEIPLCVEECREAGVDCWNKCRDNY
ncbi:MAG: hypothetical protein WBD99_10220 [Thermodesulfobacteriota bacterium]